MAEDLNEYFISDFNNGIIMNVMKKTGVDPYYNKKKFEPFGYNLMKYNCVIMLKEILKHTLSIFK